MKRIYIKLIPVMIMAFSSCDDSVEIDEVLFMAEPTTITSGETVTFTVGNGADALAIFYGDNGNDFQRSRLNLVEMPGYSEDELRNNVFAERIDALKEYRNYIPDDGMPAGAGFTGGGIQLFEGTIVPWDYSDVTNSQYIELNLTDRSTQTFSFSPGAAVIPTMLDINLGQNNAMDTGPDDDLFIFMAAPDGFTSSSDQGFDLKFGVQLVIGGIETGIAYSTQGNMREIVVERIFDLNGIINAFQSDNPGVDMSQGIDEVRLIFNADEPGDVNDDGDLLTYTGRVYIQEILVGNVENMYRKFDEGVTLPFVHRGTTIETTHTYNTPGTYTAMLVATYIGGKKYSDDGYRTNRANEILFSEYDIERVFKQVVITVN